MANQTAKEIKNRPAVIARTSLIKALLMLAMLKRVKKYSRNVSIRLAGYRIYSPDYDTLSFLLKEKFIAEEYFFSAVRENPVIVDCGSSIGISVLYFKCLYPQATIHCIEPYSRSFAFLKKNVTANNLTNIVLHDVALAAFNGIRNLYIPSTRAAVNSAFRNLQGREKVEQVECVRLAELLVSMDSIDLIKIDIEGGEYEVIADLFNHSRETIVKIRMFIIEYHHSHFRDNHQLDRFLAFFTENGYSVSAQILHPQTAFSDILVRAQRE